MLTIDHFHSRRYHNTHYKQACRPDRCPSVEYRKYMSKLEVALDQSTRSRCRHLNRWKYCRKGEAICRDAVRGRMQAKYYRAQSLNHHLVVVRLIRIVSFVCGRDSGDWCEDQCRSLSSSSNVTVDKDPCCVSNMKCRNNVKKHPDGLSTTPTIS